MSDFQKKHGRVLDALQAIGNGELRPEAPTPPATVPTGDARDAEVIAREVCGKLRVLFGTGGVECTTADCLSCKYIATAIQQQMDARQAAIDLVAATVLEREADKAELRAMLMRTIDERQAAETELAALREITRTAVERRVEFLRERQYSCQTELHDLAPDDLAELGDLQALLATPKTGLKGTD